MTNFRLTSGPFSGSIIAGDTQILDIAYSDMDDDLQMRIRDFAESEYAIQGDDYTRGGRIVRWNEICQDYENSWEAEPTEEDIDLLPLSNCDR